MARHWITHGIVALAGGVIGAVLGGRATIGFLADAQGKTRSELFIEAQTQKAMRGVFDDDPTENGGLPSESANAVSPIDLSELIDLGDSIDQAFTDGVSEFPDGGLGVDIDIEETNDNREDDNNGGAR